MIDGRFRVEALMAAGRDGSPPVVPLDHWHLSVNGGPEECGPFSTLAHHAVLELWGKFSAVERACKAYPTRTGLRCDVCEACRVYDRLTGAAHWLMDLREQFFVQRAAFEVRRADLNFDEVLPCGTRLRVALRDPKTPCFRYDELNLR